MNVRLEPYAASDSLFFLDGISKLYTELGEEAGSLDFLSPDLLERIFTNGSTTAYKICDGNTAVGLITLTESQAVYAGGKYGTIDEMFILPEHRNRGVGSLALQEIVKVAALKGWKRIDVTAPTDDKWQATVEFYNRNEFHFTGPKLKRVLD